MPLNEAGNIAMTAGMLVLCLLSVLGNLLTTVATYRIPKLRTRTNILIVNLAVSDILISLLAAPMRVFQTDEQAWSLKLGNCRIVIAVTLFFCNASVLNLTLISIDRAVSIAAPLTYNHSYASGKFALQIAASWMTSITISLLPLLGFGWKIEHEREDSKKSLKMCRYLTILDADYVLLVFTVAVLCPLLVMLICYAYIFKKALHHLKRIAAVESIGRSNNHQTENDQSTYAISCTTSRPEAKSKRSSYRSFLFKKELKAAKMVAMVIGFFVVCVTPIVLVDVAEIACGHPCAPEGFVLFAVCLSYMNPAVNILAYATISSDYRRAYKRILSSLFSCGRCSRSGF